MCYFHHARRKRCNALGTTLLLCVDNTSHTYAFNAMQGFWVEGSWSLAVGSWGTLSSLDVDVTAASLDTQIEVPNNYHTVLHLH